MPASARLPLASVPVLGVGLALAQAAPAQARAAITLTVPAQSTANAPIPYSWTARRVPAGARLELQRQVGTGGVWQRVSRLRRSSGSGTLAGRPLGLHQVRVAAVRRGRVLASNRKTLDVFGPVPLGTLLGQNPQTYTGPTFSFSYVAAGSGRATPATVIRVSAATNNCRSVHFDAVMKGDGAPGSVTVVQETADPVSVNVPVNVVTGLDAQLRPRRSWSVNLGTTDPAGGVANALLNGTASCDSTERVVDGILKT